MKTLYGTLFLVFLWMNCTGWYEAAKEPHKIAFAIWGTAGLAIFANAIGFLSAVYYYEGDQSDEP